MHPKEYEITKDLIDILIKKNETVTQISNDAPIENGKNEDLSKNTT